jgi:hypothetical protein
LIARLHWVLSGKRAMLSPDLLNSAIFGTMCEKSECGAVHGLQSRPLARDTKRQLTGADGVQQPLVALLSQARSVSSSTR